MDNLTTLEKKYIISILASLSEYEAFMLLEKDKEKERTKKVIELTEDVNDFNLKVYEKLVYIWEYLEK